MSWDADIPPEMSSIAVDQVRWGHIKGVANLHKFCIAHRDVKEEGEVVVDGYCRTKDWMMTPKVEEKST